MEITKLHDGVYQIDNFLTMDELAEIFELISSTPAEDWFGDDSKADKDFADFWYGKNLFIDGDTILNRVNEKMKNLMTSYHYYPPNIAIQRYFKGDFINEHRDQWNPDLPYYIGYGFCLYYNDNYQGGELEYPELGIKIKPKANSLYIHAGNVLHRSWPVLDDNTRYFSTVFVRGTDEEPTTLDKELFK